MDAHDELFYRLNDPDPHTQAMAELDMLDEIFGGNFVERWLKCRCQAQGLEGSCGSGTAVTTLCRAGPLDRHSAQ